MRTALSLSILLACLAGAGCSLFQPLNPPRSTSSPERWDRPPEILPSQAEGMARLQRSLVYPRYCRDAGAEGRVFVRFVVDRYGYVRDATVARGIHPSCDAEALRVVRLMAFKPGLENGQPVDVEFSVPVMFRIR